MIDESLWRIVRGFCCDNSGNPRAIDAFGRLLDDDQEEVIRRRVRKWDDQALETLSFCVTAPAHSCWTHGKMIAFYHWLSAGMAAAASHHKKVYPVEAPLKGSLQFRLVKTDEVLVELRADPSFPVDGTGLVISTLLGSQVT